MDQYFRNPETGKLKEHFIFIVDNGPSKAPSHPMVKMWLACIANVLQLKSVTQKSFAEYHSEMNPVERVHAVENRTLSNEVSSSTGVHKTYTKGDQQHKENMECMANEVANCLKTARYNGKSIITEHGIGEEDHFVFNDENQLLTFLSRSESLKNENNDHYFPQNNPLWQEVALLWDLHENFVACYREDYQMLENTFDEEEEQTCISNKYTTTILNLEMTEDDKKYLFAQPTADYVRWFKIEMVGKKHKIVKRLVETQKLDLPPRLEKYDGDIHSLPPSITDLSQISLFKLREILRYHNVLDCGTIDELAIRVGMVISGNTRLAFKREFFAIKKSNNSV